MTTESHHNGGSMPRAHAPAANDRATVARFAFRATAEDVRNMETIASHLRDRGVTFATRTDGLRAALRHAAANPAIIEGTAA